MILRSASTLLVWIVLGLTPAIARSDELRRNGFVLSPASIPAREIIAGGPARDGIPALEQPATEPVADSSWGDDERVLAVVVGAESRAYPVAILNWHELVNDSLGGVPILVSFCPLCGTGLVFDRRVAGTTRSFGVSGLLYHSDLLMYDGETESLWSQVSAEAVTGALRGQRLSLLRAHMDRWGRWRRAHPESSILSRARLDTRATTTARRTRTTPTHAVSSSLRRSTLGTTRRCPRSACGSREEPLARTPHPSSRGLECLPKRISPGAACVSRTTRSDRSSMSTHRRTSRSSRASGLPGPRSIR